MNKTVYFHYGSDNHLVIDFYLDTLKLAFEKSGYEVKEVNYSDAKTMDKNNYIVVIGKVFVLKWYLKGFRNFVLWSQGLLPDESAMRHNNSKIRFFIGGLIERFAIKKSKLVIMVSEAMKHHFEQKYHINFGENFFLMPCYNCELEKESFFVKNKYSDNTFCYVGSLTIWQCFEQTVELYKKIEENYSNTKFIVCTGEQEKAKSILTSKGVKNYTVQFVPQAELPNVLAQCKFGFIIREDVVVNNVATPTKLSTYLSNGIIPIVSDAINEYASYFKGRNYLISMPVKQDLDLLDKYIKGEIDASDVYSEYSKFYNDYYNTDRYIANLSDKINKVL